MPGRKFPGLSELTWADRSAAAVPSDTAATAALAQDGGAAAAGWCCPVVATGLAGMACGAQLNAITPHGLTHCRHEPLPEYLLMSMWSTLTATFCA